MLEAGLTRESSSAFVFVSNVATVLLALGDALQSCAKFSTDFRFRRVHRAAQGVREIQQLLHSVKIIHYLLHRTKSTYMAHQSGTKRNAASQQAKTGMQQLLKPLDNMQQPLYWLNAYFLRFAVPRDFHLGVGTWLNRVQLVFPREVSLPEISGKARLRLRGASPLRRKSSIRAGESCSD